LSSFFSSFSWCAVSAPEWAGATDATVAANFGNPSFISYHINNRVIIVFFTCSGVFPLHAATINATT
jgi:hypothetical protein